MKHPQRRLLATRMALLLLLACSFPAVAGGPRGVFVDTVTAESPAAQADLRSGDKILGWSSTQEGRRSGGALATVFEWQDLTSSQSLMAPVRLKIDRGGGMLTVELATGEWGIHARPGMPGQGWDLFVQGRALQADHRVPEGLAKWQEAETRCVRRKAWGAAAWVAQQAGSALAKAGRGDEAKAAFEKSCGFADRSEDPVARWRARRSFGSFYRDQQDPVSAEAQYQEALRLATEGECGSLDEAFCLQELGSLVYSRGDLERAESFFRRVYEIRAKAAPGTLFEARASNNIGLLLAARGRLAEARPFYERAVALKGRLHPDTLDEALSLNNLGMLLQQSGDLEGAEQAYNRALEIKQRLAPGSEDLAVSLNNLGVLLRDRGDLPGAEATLRRALAVHEALNPMGERVAGTLLNLGLTAYARGDLVTAESNWRRALALNEAIQPSSLESARCYNNLAMLFVKRGDLEEGERLYTLALEIKRRKAPDSLEVATTLLNLGALAAERGNLESARALCQQALALRQKISPNSLNVALAMNNLGDVEGQAGNAEAEIAAYTRALAFLQQEAPGGLDEAQVQQNLGGRYSRKVDSREEAQRHFLLALEARRRLAPGSADLAETCYALGLLSREGGDRASALAYLREAVEVLEAQRGRVGGGARAAERFSAQYAEFYRTLVDLLVEAGDPEGAFSILERYRARAFLDMLAERDLDFRKDAPATLLREARLLEKAYDDQQELLADPNLQKYPTKQDEARRALAEIRAKQAALVERIRRESPRLASLQYPQTLDTAGASAALPAGCLFLSYCSGERRTLLLALMDGKLETFVLPIGREALAREIRAFRLAVMDPSSGEEASRKGRALFDRLIRPASGQLGKARLVLLCPDGPLHALPFAALKDRSGRFFGERYAFSRTSSATVVAEGLRRPRPTEWAVPLEAFGDPVTSSTEPSVSGQARSAVFRRDFSPLPFSRVEVARLCALVGGGARCLLGPEATEARAKALDTSVRRVHFACHAFVDERFPLDSALVLSLPAQPGEENGIFQAWEVFEGLRLDADLVTLSACETALGREMGGEGLVGLTRAFQYAGARNILASLWRVSDESTADFMARFYEHLLSGLPEAESLRLARGDMARPQPPRKASATVHPFHWAAFELIGEGR